MHAISYTQCYCGHNELIIICFVTGVYPVLCTPPLPLFDSVYYVFTMYITVMKHVVLVVADMQ